jgi:amino acid adenylation domain-containing protein
VEILKSEPHMIDENDSKQLNIAAGQYTKEKEYWLNRLAGEPEPVGFQPDYAPGPGLERRSPAAVSLELPGEMVSKLTKLSNNSDLRLYIALTACLIALMHKYTGREDIMTGAPIFKQTVEGPLINTVLTLRNTAAGDMTFRQLLMQVSNTLYDANENQNFPIESLLYRLNIPYSKGADFPLFEVAVLLENLHERKYLDRVHLKMIFSFAWEKQENRIRGKVEYDARWYREDSIKRIIIHFILLLEAVFRDMDLGLSRIDIVPKEEKRRLLYEFNDTAADYPGNKTLHELFAEQAKRTPEGIALVGRSDRSDRFYFSITYRELHEQSGGIAGALIKKGVLPNNIVGIMVERSVEMIGGILGILKSGAAYLPIDPGYPEERIIYMLKDSGAGILLTTGKIERVIDRTYLSDVSHEAEKLPAATLAYIIYTSGTTGRPKGVLVEHRNVINTVTWYAKQYGVGRGGHVLQITDYTFDPSVEQIFGTLLHGASLYIISRETAADIYLLRRFIDVHQVQVINFVPMFLKDLLEAGPVLKSLRAVISGGDKLEETVKDSILEKGYELYNHYGPTEITVDALTAKCTPGPVVLGTPIANASCYILGVHEALMPVGVAGELYIGGSGVARGYLNNPELTGDRFLSIFNRSYRTYGTYISKKLYKTGDLARRLVDGNIEFLGRIDHQVKIRGYRVELGEIESHLRHHPQVKDALVVVIGTTGGSGDKKLCAYVTGKPGAGALDIPGIKEYLLARLPGYMTPAYFCQLDEIPLTPGGKVNRKALPFPDQYETGAVYTPPGDELEKTLVDLWAEVLEIDPAIIGIDSDFFQCGGHSLNATVLAARIHKELNVKVPMVVLFENPFIRGLARCIRGAVKEKHPAVEMAEEKEYYSLSPAQKRLYILQQMEPDATAYNLPVVMELEGYLDKEKVEGVFVQLIRRHESFRTSFELVDGEPIQKISKNVEFKIQHHDSTHLIQPVIHPFDLARPPLLWVVLTKLETKKHLLAMDMHHIITDGISTAIMVREFMALYEGKELLPLKLQYKDFARWQNDWLGTGEMKKQEQYWKMRFQGPIPILQLPYDYPRPVLQSFTGNSIRFQLEAGETASLKGLARKENVTFFIVLFSIYSLVLSRLGGHEDIMIGTPVAGRGHADLQGIIGMFVNTLALRSRMEENTTFAAFLKQVKEQTTEDFENRDYPFEMLVEKVSIARDAGRNPLFDVMFSFENMDIPALEIKGLKAAPVEVDSGAVKFDLNLAAVESAHGLLCRFEYCTKLFKKETIERFIIYFKEAVSAIVNNANRKMVEIDIMPPEERNRLLFEFNHTGAEFPRDKTIHRLYEEQAKRTPDHMVIFGHGRMRPDIDNNMPMMITYRHLNDCSNRLAGLLMEKGILADNIIGIMGERSIEMIIGILGILKAGGAYLPIDPEYPQERIEYMLKDSGAKIFLTLDAINRVPTPHHLSLHPSTLPPFYPSNPSNLAYIIYTSGTTSRPKGTLIQHRNVVRLLFNDKFQFDFSDRDTWTLFHSFCFDFSVWEMYGALLYGGKLVIVPKMIARDTAGFLELLNREAVTILNQTPPAFYNLINEDLNSRRAGKKLYLKYVIFGGEALNPLKLKYWQSKYPQTRLINMFGITETTVHVTYKEITEKDMELNVSNIGKPIPTLSVYILDKHLKLVPVGVRGEIWVGGGGVSRGYLNRPQLTAERFCLRRPGAPRRGGPICCANRLCWNSFVPGSGREMPHNSLHNFPSSHLPNFSASLFPPPRKNFSLEGTRGLAHLFNKTPTKKDYMQLCNHASMPPPYHPITPSTHSPLYLTGDLGRYLANGDIEYLGRIDQQVKIRGFRIELGEIESRLSGHENVKEVIVIDRTDRTGDKYLCAYIVFQGPIDTDQTELKSYLLQTLPEYMVPAHFVKLESIPLNPNGKVDRKALPEPGAKPDSQYIAPGNNKEREIAEIWKQVLGQEKVSIDDNFFDVGGNSLKVIKLTHELKKHLGIEFPTAKVFQYTTIAAQARYIGGTGGTGEKKNGEADVDMETSMLKNRLMQRREKASQ